MSILDVYEKKPKRNHFNLSHSRKYTMQDFGVLYPILCKELMPGDVFKHSHEHFMQFEPMVSTVLHRFRVQTYYFFVPNRIIWDNFDEFINMDPNKFINPPIHPYIYASDLFNGIQSQSYFPNFYYSHGSLADYLGFNTYHYTSGHYQINNSQALSWDANTTKLNALPFRAYQKIWYDYFRDEESNASNTENCATSDGNSLDEKLVTLRSKAWMKDPFTTALKSTTPHGYVPSINGTFNLEDLRNLKSQTTFFEKIMRAGSRPQEFTHAIFGVKPKDYRLDMPEFLNASTSTIVLGNVYNSEATINNASGTLNSNSQAQGYTVSTARSSSVAGGFRYRAVEFGWLIGLACIVPDSVYYDGLPVELRERVNNLDYPFPDFARTGDQAVLNSEILMQQEAIGTNTKAVNDAVYGFAPRYWQYKRYLNGVHGMFRTPQYLSYHDARRISHTPTRNQSFVYVANEDGTGRVNHVQQTGQFFAYPNDPSMLKRIFNIKDAPLDELIPPIAIGDIFHNISALRPLPFSSIPRL